MSELIYWDKLNSETVIISFILIILRCLVKF